MFYPRMLRSRRGLDQCQTTTRLLEERRLHCRKGDAVLVCLDRDDGGGLALKIPLRRRLLEGRWDLVVSAH